MNISTALPPTPRSRAQTPSPTSVTTMRHPLPQRPISLLPSPTQPHIHNTNNPTKRRHSNLTPRQLHNLFQYSLLLQRQYLNGIPSRHLLSCILLCHLNTSPPPPPSFNFNKPFQ
ncbi:hypothetical protein BCR33DRAFT_345498 [Rhizoclosmatium globosum]|uniref:Uncharacterized protein n=1 Tax=Rhizoclosmatium globosum TaxID=329046 RepID=A0A1Y2C2Y8_9FUNG|nr:hypothetical protein BCR33DRAFT_345498 [Rhizoclosmatium globosum]|eukprot:ORY41389.1 hypothetical protein BCR33DRAFT_345498 [Rhizoclosmatium globosum]